MEADSVVSEDEYRGWRYQHGVAEGSVEMPQGEARLSLYDEAVTAKRGCHCKTYPLNLDGLNKVSFKLGCYVGQDYTARTQSKVPYPLCFYYLVCFQAKPCA